MAQNQVFRGVARDIVEKSDRTEYCYHDTPVVSIYYCGRSIRLNSGGYRTATTKLAMNQVSNEYGLGFIVFQDAGEWWVHYKGRTTNFVDDMFLYR